MELLDDLIIRLNPKLSEVVQDYTAPNFNRHEAPIGVPNYVFDMDHSTINPYPNAQSVDSLINNQRRMESQRISHVDERDLLNNAMASNRIVGMKRHIADQQRHNAVYQVKNTGQQYADRIISDLYDNSVEDIKLKTNIAQNLTEKNVYKQTKKLDAQALINKARLRAKINN